MTKERMLILDMLQAGKISPAQALQLLDALGDSAAPTHVPSPEEAMNAAADGQIFELETDEAADDAEDEEETIFSAENGQRVQLHIRGGIPPIPPVPPIAPVHVSIPPVPPIPPIPPIPPLHVEAHNLHLHIGRRRRYPDPSYAVAMRRGGVDFTPEQLIQLQDAGVEPEDVDALLAVRRQEWTTAGLVEMLIHEVSPALVLQLHDLGMGKLSPSEISQFAIHEVSPDYIRQIQALGFSNLTAHEVLEFGIHEVNLDAVRALQAVGPISARDAIDAGIHEVSASYVEALRSVMPDLSPRKIIEMRLHDVTPRMIETLFAAGFTNVSPNEVLEVAIHDADLENLAWFRETLGENLSLRDLVQFSIHEVSREYVEELLALEIPGLNKQSLVQMRIHDVELGDVQRAREAYEASITAADLIDMAIHKWR